MTIPVFSDRLSKTLPVSPQITGTPAAGFELAAASVGADVRDRRRGRRRAREAARHRYGADLGQRLLVVADGRCDRSSSRRGSSRSDTQNVRVTIVVRTVTSSRSFEVGVRIVGGQPGLAYATDLDRVLITVGGSVADLDRLIGSTLVVDLDVSALGPGKADVTATATLPAGLTLVAANPAKVSVTVSAIASSQPSGG